MDPPSFILLQGDSPFAALFVYRRQRYEKQTTNNSKFRKQVSLLRTG